MGKAHGYSRRKFLASITAASAAAVLAACGTPEIPTATSGAARPTTASGGTASGSTPAAAGGGSPTAAGGAAMSASGTGTAAPAMMAAGGQLKMVPRNRTLIHGITGTQLTDYNSFNPLAPAQGVSSATGYPFSFEPLFYYNAYNTPQACGPEGLQCKDGYIPWIGESFEYTPDFTGLTIKLKKGVEWNDGTPFTARDVAFTVNMLKTNGSKVKWGIDMQTWVKTAEATDDQTIKFTLNNPNPRFMLQFFAYHFDIGIEIQPEHIWKDVQDPTMFTNLDIAKGLPVVTGPWKLVFSSPQQRIYDRRDDWWAKKTGFRPLPAPERIIVIPGTDETKMVQLIINNEADLTIDLRPNNMKAVLGQNPKVTTWTGKDSPFGYRDWWPIGLGFNCMKEPFNDPEMRYAVNYAIDRKQVVDVGYQGAGDTTLLPFPKFPALEKYTDLVKETAEKAINVTDPKKTTEIMMRKGYKLENRSGDMLWVKDGKTVSMQIDCSGNLFQDIAPIIAQQLRKAGFDASFKLIQGPEFADRVYQGTSDAYLNGHGGSVRDPYFTLRLYHSRYSKPTGERATYSYRWKNEQYDALVDQIGSTGENDPKLNDLFKQAMEIWIKELPDIGIVQWFHRIPTNTTYWTNFPSQQNPYINTAYWHRTSPLWINALKPVQ